MTKELREKIRKLVIDHFDILDTRWKWMEWFLDCVEQEIIEAERRGREKMRKECLAVIPPDHDLIGETDYQRGTFDSQNSRNHTIRTAISSLK